jgi:hypothetical protein
VSGGPQHVLRAELAELRRAFKETVLNLETVVEQANRALRRARQRLDELSPENEDEMTYRRRPSFRSGVISIGTPPQFGSDSSSGVQWSAADILVVNIASCSGMT